MEQSSSGKRQIEGELKLIAVQHNRKDFPPNVVDSKEFVANDVTVCLIYLICGLSKWSRRLKSLLLRINAFIKSSVTDQPQQIQLQCVSTKTKGRGMVSLIDVPQATLLHTEEPYAADLCHNYIQLNSEAKLELHIYSIVLLKCLHHCYGSNLPINRDTISQASPVEAQVAQPEGITLEDP
ncbi:hypothetical protein Tco_0653351 [Tanacetum coccineum]|uniref:Uncharacterized protein n=1 Tax=Tanacetum coccineum TaxID=301880 RepID=A0ABQ4X0B0_9ASTR